MPPAVTTRTCIDDVKTMDYGQSSKLDLLNIHSRTY